MVSNDDFDGKATNLNCFYLHINFEQKYPKLAIVYHGIKRIKVYVQKFIPQDNFYLNFNRALAGN